MNGTAACQADVCQLEVLAQVRSFKQLPPDLGPSGRYSILHNGDAVKEPEVMLGQFGGWLVGQVKDADVLTGFDVVHVPQANSYSV